MIDKCVQALGWFIKSDDPSAQRARRISKIVALGALFAVLFWIVPLKDVLRALLTADPLLLILGVALGFVVNILRSVQLAILSWKQGIKLSLVQVIIIEAPS